jgi:transcriptional regulator with XRE-family HTH domain
MSTARHAARGGRRRRKSTRTAPIPAPHLVLVASNDRDPETVTGAQFCARVKAARERRGVSLAAIAEATKLTASLFDAFERGDISRWPKGIYRRAYFRDYVTAIGLPPEPTVREFLTHFPDEDEFTKAEAASQASRDTLLRRLMSWWPGRKR